MTIGMLIAGIVCLLAGLLAIGFGIPINEFGLGNTLILAGAVTACTGLIILSLWVVVREMRSVAGRLGVGAAPDWKSSAPQPAALPRPATEDSAGGPGTPPGSPAPWLEEAAGRDRPRQEPPSAPGPPPVKPRRHLMFSSTSRRERERLQARPGDPSGTEPRPDEVTAPPMEINEPPPATFDDAWPKSERERPADAPPARRPPRTPSTISGTAG